jgi:hypothetical protein
MATVTSQIVQCKFATSYSAASLVEVATSPNHLPVEKGILVSDIPVGNMSAISYDGNYLPGSEKFNKKLFCVVNLKTGEFKRLVIGENNYATSTFSFFYENTAYFYNPSTLEIEATVRLDIIE